MSKNNLADADKKEGKAEGATGERERSQRVGWGLSLVMWRFVREGRSVELPVAWSI
jgi:hypothetical protein